MVKDENAILWTFTLPAPFIIHIFINAAGDEYTVFAIPTTQLLASLVLFIGVVAYVLA